MKDEPHILKVNVNPYMTKEDLETLRKRFPESNWKIISIELELKEEK